MNRRVSICLLCILLCAGIFPTAVNAQERVVFTQRISFFIKFTDARGFVTRTFYDAIQRPIHVFTGLTAAEAAGNLAACTAASAGSTHKTHTELQYTNAGLNLPRGGVMKGNPGGSAFDSSGFKPTLAIRHAAVRTAVGMQTLRTYAVYDALYRPLCTETEYEAGSYAVASTAYGTVSGDKESLETNATDDRGKITRTLLDGLQRPLSVTDGFGTVLAATSQSFYASTEVNPRANQ